VVYGNGTNVPLPTTRVPLGSSSLEGRLCISGGNCLHLDTELITGLEPNVISTIRQLWTEEDGQDVAEYAVMLAVILVIVIGTVRLIGGNANNVFSEVGSAIQQ
jgi:Flp pilus assembly pilin Flp